MTYLYLNLLFTLPKGVEWLTYMLKTAYFLLPVLITISVILFFVRLKNLPEQTLSK